MQRLSVGLLLIAFSIFGTTKIWAKGFDQFNDPRIMSYAGSHVSAPIQMKTNLDDLPKSIFLSKDHMPWTDTYWPTYKGGISLRFQKDDVIAAFWSRTFKRYKQTKKSLQKMSEAQIAKLSPSEKFDIYKCDYDFTLTQSEIERTKDVVSHPNDKRWYGLCHGWAPAALNFDEPHCVTVTNADGIKIKFGSSDVKALLTYFQGEVDNSYSCLAGQRCNIPKSDLDKHPELKKDPTYEDINPGSFHVIISNLLANQQGFVMDKSPDAAVWNQPIYGFETRQIGENPSVASDAANGAVKEIIMESTVHWIGELQPSVEHYNGKPEAERVMQRKSVYKYVLEIDQNKNILGGRWLDQSIDDHPDFVWMKGRQDFKAVPGWEKLGEIYEASIKKQ